MPSKRREQELLDRMWDRVRPLLPPRPPHPHGGRPFADDKSCFAGIVYKDGAEPAAEGALQMAADRPRPPKPPSRREPPCGVRPFDKSKWISGHWRWVRDRQTWDWVRGHWSK